MGKIKRTFSEILTARSLISKNQGAGATRVATSDGRAVFVASVPDRTAVLVQGIEVLLEHHDATPGVIAEIRQQLEEYLGDSPDEKIWVKRVKYCLAFPLAEFLRNEPPAQPDKPFSFTGGARSWINSRLHAFNARNVHLWSSWFQAKRCCLPSSEEFIEDTYVDHLAALTSPDPGRDDLIDRVFANKTFLGVLSHIKRRLGPYLNRSADEYSASPSACFERTRVYGGAHSELISLVRGSYKYWDAINHTTTLRSMVYLERVHPYGRVLLEEREPYGRDDWEDLGLLSRSGTWWNRPLSCEIRAVVEPLKVRVISKGEALPYFSQKPLQKGLHTIMRDMNCFRLIGEPISPQHLLPLHTGVEDEWFSVDYSAATDGLSWKFTSQILEDLLQGDGAADYNRALRVLGPHQLYYPVPPSREYRGIQTNGQLMGSILSFPILCLANLAVYLLVNEERHKGWTDEKILSSVLVNGDDMLYRAPASLWSDHINIGEGLGLKMSIGKAYHHPYYANMNSMSYIYKDCGVPREVPFLNLGLYFQSAVQRKVSYQETLERREETNRRRALGLPELSYPEEGVISCVNKLLDGCREKKRSQVLGRYLVRNKKAIKDECTFFFKRKTGPLVRCVRNLFIHPSLGGLGVKAPRGWRYRITRMDYRLSNSLTPSGVDYAPLWVRPTPRPIKLLEPPNVPWSKPDRLPEIPIFRWASAKKVSRALLEGGVLATSKISNLTLLDPSYVRR